jgi:hypothetical protein
MTNEEKKEVGGGFKSILEALTLIAKEEGNQGKIKCPKCGNDLHWTRASSNKHVWGKCKTANCLSWMQ